MVIVSNHPHRFHLESTRSIVAYAVDGIGPTDFHGGMFGTMRQALRFRERHADFLALWESIEQHRHIPITFDGTSHHLAFGQEVPALLVGRQYSVPDANGALVTATLEDAVALPSQKLIYGIYRTQDGERFTCTNPMTEGEAKAYAENPDTFFGVIKQATPLRTPLQLYDALFETYGKSTRENLLRFMENGTDIEELRKLPRDELGEIYCEGLVYATMARTNAQDPAGNG